MKKSNISIYLKISQANKLITKHPDIIMNVSICLNSNSLLNEHSNKLEKFNICVKHLIKQNPIKLINKLIE